jgi:hypothetical protein
MTEISMYDKLKSIEPFTLAGHTDADGAYSAVLLKRIFQTKGKVEMPKFGEYTTDVAVDLGAPTNKEWTGVAIDHHPDHPTERKYTLYHDHCPTGLVIYNNLKQYIKKEDTWLVVGSLVGDGQVELCPPEIWEANPLLLNGRGTMYKTGFKVGTSDYPLFVILSSGINSMCRLGFPEQALQMLENFDNPIDMLESSEIKDASEKMRKETDAVYGNKPILESLGHWITLARIRTTKPEIKVGGIIGAALSQCDSKQTYIVLNESSGDVSIRGTFAKYITSKLNAMGYKAGGHAGFAGANVELVKIPEFVKDCRKIKL